MLKQCGLTLIEMLVTLVLVTLVTTLLTQGVTHMLQLKMQFTQFLANDPKNQLQTHWFKLSTQAIIAAPTKERDHYFSGSALEIKALSLNPLQGPKGIPTVISWYITQENNLSRLYYQQQNQKQAWLIKTWKTKAAFRYLTPQGQLVDKWPVPMAAGFQTQLPLSIYLVLEEKEQLQPHWIVPLMVRLDPKPPYLDEMTP